MGANNLKLGFLLPTRGLVITGDRPKDAESLFRLAEMAEESGMDSLWVGDSVTAKPRPEPLTTLAAVAARTHRVRLGTSVLLAALRPAVLLAQVVATVDLISGGRTILAVGVGGAFNEEQKQEWLSVGIDPTQRARRLEELVYILKRLGTEESVSFEGRHFKLHSVHMEPRPVQEGGVPILLACHLRAGKEAQFRRAAKLGDGFISISETPEGFAQIAEKVRMYAMEFGKDFDKMESVFYMTININQNMEKAQEEADKFITMYYGMNIWRNIWGPYGPSERVVESIRKYAKAGAQTIIVRFASFDQESQLKTFIKEVLPVFK